MAFPESRPDVLVGRALGSGSLPLARGWVGDRYIRLVPPGTANSPMQPSRSPSPANGERRPPHTQHVITVQRVLGTPPPYKWRGRQAKGNVYDVSPLLLYDRTPEQRTERGAEGGSYEHTGQISRSRASRGGKITWLKLAQASRVLSSIIPRCSQTVPSRR